MGLRLHFAFRFRPCEMLFQVSLLGTALLVVVLATDGYFFDENQPRYLTAAVGDYIVFNCEVDFPQTFPIPYKVLWRRQVR